MLLVQIDGFHLKDFSDDFVFPLRRNDFPVLFKLFDPLFQLAAESSIFFQWILQVFHRNIFHKYFSDPSSYGSFFIAMFFTRIIEHEWVRQFFQPFIIILRQLMGNPIPQHIKKLKNSIHIPYTVITESNRIKLRIPTHNPDITQ